MEIDQAGIGIKMIKKAVTLRGKQALEIGCGNGRVTSSLVKEVGNMLAVDPDFNLIARARNRVKDVDFLMGSGENLGFRNESFNLVLFTHSLHHQESKLALQEAHRVLKPSGQLVILEPLVNGEIQQFFNLFNDETLVLKQAAEAIKTSSFPIRYQREFLITWKFDDLSELYTYFFAEHQLDPNDRDIKRMKELLGPKQHRTPIYLQDQVIIFVLPKGQ